MEICSHQVERVFVTYSWPVLPYKPQVVAEERQNTDAEHGRHKKKKQYMEFGVSVWQLILGKRWEKRRERERNQSQAHIEDIYEKTGK